MRKLVGLLALLLAFPAFAETYNLRQLDTGTVWSGSNPVTEARVPVGGHISVTITNAANSATYYGHVHKNSHIDSVIGWLNNDGLTTDNGGVTITITTANSLTSGNTSASTFTDTGISLSVGSTVGRTYTTNPAQSSTSAVYFGDVIAVHASGVAGQSNAQPAQVHIFID